MGRGEDISNALPEHLSISTHPTPDLCGNEMCVEGVDTDQIVEDSGSFGRKGCSFECLPSDVGVMQRTAGAVPVVTAKSVGSAKRPPQNRESCMGAKHLGPNVAQKVVRHGGRGGVGCVGKVILPNNEVKCVSL